MIRRAFVPAALIEAQPRVYKSFRGRQLRGLLAGAAGAILVLVLVGLQDITGYALAFMAALPGFAYGYYQPEGKPVEAWLRVIYRYYATPQRISAVVPRIWSWPVLRAQIGPVLRAMRYLIRGRVREQRRPQSVGR